MAYSELIKNFNRIRDYMREFYVYGFKSREEFTKKSARSYDDERRRVESWLGAYMQFRQTPDGKNVFLSIDSRTAPHNPLYQAWKAKSFTDGDVTLHFILFDILHSPETSLTLNEIMREIDGYMAGFANARTFDASTVRKKLKEYTQEGLILALKNGKTVYYRRAEAAAPLPADVLDFFSEVAPCGVIGSFLLDKLPPHRERFAFKHHYITGAMDSQIVCDLLSAITDRCCVTIDSVNRRKQTFTERHVVPLQLFFSVQNGRQYVLAYVPRFDRISSFRIDSIVTVTQEGPCERFDELRRTLAEMRRHMWGVCTQNRLGDRLEHVSFTVRYGANETHIPERLEREKRCGRVERLDEHTSRFSADVYDATELVPWMRTFICRITDVSFSDRALEDKFREDVAAMYALYGVTKGGENA